MSEQSTLKDRSVEYALRQVERCRNYGPELVENEQVIVILGDEIERLQRELAETKRDWLKERASWSSLCHEQREQMRVAPEPAAAPSSDELKRKLAAAGVFKGFEGLEGLLNAADFWDQQSYGTRLYYGAGIADYLHRSVLRSAIEILKQPASSQPPSDDRYTLDQIEEGLFRTVYSKEARDRMKTTIEDLRADLTKCEGDSNA